MSAALVQELGERLGANAVETRDDGEVRIHPRRTAVVAELFRYAFSRGLTVRTAPARPARRLGRQTRDGEVLLVLDRLQGALQVNDTAGTVVVPGGTSGADLAWRLHREGRWLWPRPLPFYAQPLASYLAGPGLAAEMTAFTMWESPLMALEAVLADGTVLKTGLAPRSAAGPDYRTFLVGAGDRLGVITRVTWRTVERSIPMLAAIHTPSLDRGLELLAAFCSTGWRPFASCLIEGDDPSSWQTAKPGAGATVLLCLRAEGARADLARSQLSGILRDGDEQLPPRAARGWYEARVLALAQRGQEALADAAGPTHGVMGTAVLAVPEPGLSGLWHQLTGQGGVKPRRFRASVIAEGFRPEGATLDVRLHKHGRAGLASAAIELVELAAAHGGLLSGLFDPGGRPLVPRTDALGAKTLMEQLAGDLGGGLNPPMPMKEY